MIKAVNFENKRIEIHKVVEGSDRVVFLKHYDDKGCVHRSGQVKYSGQEDTVNLILDTLIPSFCNKINHLDKVNSSKY